MRIGLGTASFGMKYGVANDQQINADEVNAILALSHKNQVDVIDTAQLYGDSEAVLGQNKELNQFRIVTKLDHITGLSLSDIESKFNDSLVRLSQSSLYGVMLHRGDDLLNKHAQQNWSNLQHLKANGSVKKVGVSVYTPIELSKIMAQFPIDLVQLPLNLLDQRFLESGVLTEAKNKGIEIHVRSAFLQGLLLMDIEQLPSYFESFQPHLQLLDKTRRDQNISAMTLALAFFKQLKEVDVLVLGTNSEKQWLELLDTVNSMPSDLSVDFSALASSDERLILPTNWQVQ